MEISSEIADKKILGKSIVAEARSKSTLRYLNFENFQICRVRKLWSNANYNQHSVQVKLSKKDKTRQYLF